MLWEPISAAGVSGFEWWQWNQLLGEYSIAWSSRSCLCVSFSSGKQRTKNALWDAETWQSCQLNAPGLPCHIKLASKNNEPIDSKSTQSFQHCAMLGTQALVLSLMISKNGPWSNVDRRPLGNSQFYWYGFQYQCSFEAGEQVKLKP